MFFEFQTHVVIFNIVARLTVTSSLLLCSQMSRDALVNCHMHASSKKIAHLVSTSGAL